MYQRVSFFLPQPTDWVPIADMFGPADPRDDSLRLVREAGHRLYLIGDYVSYTNSFGLGVETICLFLGIAFGTTRLGWRRPVVVAFGVTTVVTAAFLFLLVLDIYEATSAAGIVRSVVVSLFGAALAVGAVAITFKALANHSVRMQVASSALMAVLVLPVVVLLSFLAACIVGLGCV
jgi:hypothetical protein